MQGWILLYHPVSVLLSVPLCPVHKQRCIPRSRPPPKVCHGIWGAVYFSTKNQRSFSCMSQRKEGFSPCFLDTNCCIRQDQSSFSVVFSLHQRMSRARDKNRLSIVHKSRSYLRPVLDFKALYTFVKKLKFRTISIISFSGLWCLVCRMLTFVYLFIKS